MTMTEPDTHDLGGVDLRTLDGDFRAMTTIEEAESRVGITRSSGGASSGPWKNQAKKSTDRKLSTGQALFIAAVVGLSMWVVIFKLLGVI